jgi:hypothetical protein
MNLSFLLNMAIFVFVLHSLCVFPSKPIYRYYGKSWEIMKDHWVIGAMEPPGGGWTLDFYNKLQ